MRLDMVTHVRSVLAGLAMILALLVAPQTQAVPQAQAAPQRHLDFGEVFHLNSAAGEVGGGGVAEAQAPFAVVNKVSGLDAHAENEFTYEYRCQVGAATETGELTALANGQPVFSEQEFPLGTECVVVQDEQSAVREGYRVITEPQSLRRVFKITGKDNAVQAQFVNTYAKVVGGLAVTKELSNETLNDLTADQEFRFQVSWELHGVTETREFTLRAGDVFSDFPKLPLGTKVQVREIAPADSAWDLPSFKGSVGGAVEDHGDGSATITVPTEEAALLVTVMNNAHGGFGWLSFVELIPLLGGFGSG